VLSRLLTFSRASFRSASDDDAASRASAAEAALARRSAASGGREIWLLRLERLLCSVRGDGVAVCGVCGRGGLR